MQNYKYLRNKMDSYLERLGVQSKIDLIIEDYESDLAGFYFNKFIHLNIGTTVAINPAIVLAHESVHARQDEVGWGGFSVCKEQRLPVPSQRVRIEPWEMEAYWLQDTIFQESIEHVKPEYGKFIGLF